MKKAIIRRIPWILIAKAWLVAFRDHYTGVRDSYSQAKEDTVISELLYGLDPSKHFYIDVGANHPTRLSNTYRLYRQGWSGIVVEPNRSLLRMHRFFRKRDAQLAIGCGSSAGVLRFQHAVSHVLSGFGEGAMKTNDIRRTELMPVFPVDMIMTCEPNKQIGLLSIDVEGFDFEVVKGAIQTLRRTRVVVIEGNSSDSELISFFNSAEFDLQCDTLHNLIFRARYLTDQIG